jgi:peptide/nickel transport system substrate-binding protein
MFSKKTLLFLLVIVLLGVIAACGAQSEPQTVVETVVVTKEVAGEKVVETVEVEKIVKETVVVEVPAEEAPAEEAAAGEEFPRAETLYTGGTQWGPPAGFNPWNLGNYAMGTFGLCYEPLFIYDPLADEFTPWLAESGEWTSDNVYQVKVREGVTWSDGEPFTGADVKATFDIAKDAPVSISNIWQFLSSVDLVDDYTVEFTFDPALYQWWSYYLYSTPIVSQHKWEGKSAEEITSGINEDPECTGPYVAESLDQSKVVWLKKDGWWATDAYGLDPKPKRIVDIVNSGNNNLALGMVLQGQFDLNNNFLPGISRLVEGGYGVQTYYPGPPYHLSANTAWLLLNLTKPPMDDPAFRQAMAYAIDVDQIVNVVYAGMVLPANPTGLLPNWDKYIDQDVVDELGFSYDPDKAVQLLADAGYEDTNGDGFVEAPDGSEIALKVNNPAGWTDWEESNRVIVNGLEAIGIKAESNFIDYGEYVSQRNEGTFDTMIANDAQIANTPWRYYLWMGRNPIKDIATMQDGNYGRYDNQEVFDLTNQLDQTPVDDVEGMKAIMSQLQRIYLTDMPLIPLWYNGAWAQYSNDYWTNWPSSEEGSNHYFPVSWRGYWNMTTILMLCDLEPAATE